MQFLFLPRNKEQRAAPVQQQNDNANADKTIKKFLTFKKSDLVYVIRNKFGSSVKVNEPSQKPKTDEGILSVILKVKRKNVKVVEGNVYGRISTDWSRPTQRKSVVILCCSQLLTFKKRQNFPDYKNRNRRKKGLRRQHQPRRDRNWPV